MEIQYISYYVLLMAIFISHMNKIIYPNFSCIKYNYSNIINKNLDKNTISEDMVYIKNVFSPEIFQNMNNITDTLLTHDQGDSRNFFRKNMTIPAKELRKTKINDIYNNDQFIKLINESINRKITPVDCHDKSSMNLLIYNKPGDYIYWHNDPNHYFGKRFTVLIMLRNTSDVQLVYKMNQEEYNLQMEENSILIFDGSKILHKTTELKENNVRNLLSFTYCDSCNTNNYLLFISTVKEMLLGY